MTPASIELVRHSWRAADTDALVERFYATLFADDPGVRRLFLGDPVRLRRKFDDTLSVIIEHLDDPGKVNAYLHALGTSHAGYGVLPRHYALAEEALVAALGAQPEIRFDAATEAAWREAFRTLASGMLDAELERQTP